MTFEEFFGELFLGKESMHDASVSNATTTEYLTRIFSEADVLFEGMSVDQVYKGLRSIFYEDYARVTMWDDVPVELQERLIRSVGELYTRYLDGVCDDYGQNPATHTNLLAGIDGFTYMIWDMDSLECGALFPERSYLVDPIFEVLEIATNCKSLACQISGLHGLGHLAYEHPVKVKKTLKRFIKAKRARLPWLYQYATDAMTGSIE